MNISNYTNNYKIINKISPKLIKLISTISRNPKKKKIFKNINNKYNNINKN